MKPGGVFTPAGGFSPRAGFNLVTDDDDAPHFTYAQVTNAAQAAQATQHAMRATLPAGNLQGNSSAAKIDLPVLREHAIYGVQSAGQMSKVTLQLVQGIIASPGLLYLLGEIEKLNTKALSGENARENAEKIKDIIDQEQERIRANQLLTSLINFAGGCNASLDFLMGGLTNYAIEIVMTSGVTRLRVCAPGRETPTGEVRKRFQGQGNTVVQALVIALTQALTFVDSLCATPPFTQHRAGLQIVQGQLMPSTVSNTMPNTMSGNLPSPSQLAMQVYSHYAQSQQQYLQGGQVMIQGGTPGQSMQGGQVMQGTVQGKSSVQGTMQGVYLPTITSSAPAGVAVPNPIRINAEAPLLSPSEVNRRLAGGLF